MSLRLIEPSLAKVGVELVDDDRPALKCKICGSFWTPNLQADGRLPKNWWKCPNCQMQDKRHKIPWVH